jgi:hypothetical protein
VNEIRQAKIDDLKHMVRRPDAGAGDARSAQTLVHGAVIDLCFIDEREDDLRAVTEHLYQYGKLGVGGAFHAVFGDGCNYAAEVTSIFTAIACELGYLEPARRFSADEWQSFVASIPETFEEVDMRRSAVLEIAGEPSFVVGERVLCYVGPSPGDWVAFDCWEQPTTKYVIEDEHLKHLFLTKREEDPLLRDVRVPARSFNDSLVMTTYGKVLRWGPGWWLNTEPASEFNTPDDVREQLIEIDNGDPSQSLGLRRPWVPRRQP